MENRNAEFNTDWHKDQQFLQTRISGDATIQDITDWEQSLISALSQIPDNSAFKIFINLNGFSAIDIEAHKRFRNIIPLTLANYGWKVGYIKLFEEEAKEVCYTHIRGIKCVAAAHVHHDRTKIDKYSTLFDHQSERFFTNPTLAMNWIEHIKV